MMKKRHQTALYLTVLLLLLTGSRSLYAQPVLSLDPTRAVTQYHLDTWTSGLPQNTIYAVTQTPDGYLWLGTQEGLVRFDGRRFVVFDKRNTSLSNNHITALFVDRAGTLWVGTRGGGISRRDGHTFTTYTTEDGLSSDEISAIDEDAEGNLWIGTYDGGLNQRIGDRFIHYSTRDGLASNNITALHSGRSGTLWIGTRDAGLSRFQNGQLTTYTIEDGLPGNSIGALFEDRSGTLWIGTRGAGLGRLQDGRFTTYTTEDGLPSNTILTLLEDGAGTLWLGTDYGGLSRLLDETFSSLTTDEGLSYNVVQALFEDREGSLWIGTDGGGLNRLQNGKFLTYTKQEGLAHDAAYTVYEDVQGALWVGTEGGISRLHDGRITTFTTADGLLSNLAFTIHGTRDGSVWIGTYDKGLNQYRNGRFTAYTTADGLPSDEIIALYEDEIGNLWIGTAGGLGRYRSGQFSAYTTADGLASDIVTAVTKDRDGNLWVGTYDGGLQRFDAGRIAPEHSTRFGQPNDYVTAIYADDDGSIWFSTREGGLSRITGDQQVVFTTQDGLLSDKIFYILEDHAGNLWMSCNKGLFRVSKAQLDAYVRGEAPSVTSIVYDEADGLESHEFNGGSQPAGWKDRHGRLWFPTIKGVASIDPAQIPTNPQPPPVVVEQVLANGKPFSMDNQAELPPGRDKFEFHYAGLSLLAPERVRYRYMLEGSDEDWIEAGTRREAFYTNLPPGRYTFKVVAANNDGIWSAEAASVSFYLRPFFYQTAWFLLLCTFAVGLLGFGFYRLRIRHLKARQKELEALVEARTKDLREEKEKTEDALQEAERQREIAEEAKAVIEEQAEQLREMDRIKTRFFNNISHEFRTPLTLNIGPLENALTGFYGPVSGVLRQQLSIMLRNSRRLLRLINQLLDLSKLESGRMELKARPANLIPFLEGVVLSFTAFAEKKNLALGYAADREELRIPFDPEALEKVFFNLLSNAIKFTPEGGRVDVEVRLAAALPGAADPEAVEIRVKDTGPGIPEADLPFIFDRFHQVDGTVSQVQEGTGIGLSLVKELVELHGGTIEVRSELGAGTVFVITLPREIPSAERPPRIDETPDEVLTTVSRGPMVEMAVFDDDEFASNGDGCPDDEHIADAEDSRALVLVVDDNPDIREYMVGCLSGTYRVVTAIDGEDALEKTRRLRPSLIISDVMMPRLDGYELCRVLRDDAALNHIPIILLTAKASLDDKLEGLSAGADDYVPKPFNARELHARVANLLSLRAQQSALKDLNQELRQANDALSEASELKSQLLNIAAHDLKNPLNAVREFAKILKEEVGQEDHVAEILDMVRDSADQMLHLVTQLLDSAALENGKINLQKEPVSMSALARLVVERNRKQAEQKGQTLQLLADAADECMVEADINRLREAMDNLVNNAVKYSPLGKPIVVRVSSEGSAVRFSVTDQGPGLSEEDQKKLFRKFQRLSALPTGGESSTGLGLSIVKQIIEMHAGRVWADSIEGEGSTFTIELGSVPQPTLP